MLKLKNISKYYHSNDVVALGLRKINLEFKLGEFIAVTGESGSGKSTLLNVISGLDTYEDGEMYVNDEETSYYQVEEWESYRRQYIGFVFQNYNIIDSYSVYENVLMALQIQGYDKDTREERALELIRKVGLESHTHHKASKLSGGQKQRAVIARALAKDCPIIVCDEPTGNLDSESSKKVLGLLSEISKDKLVIVVTHNYEQVEEFATRRIRLFDGEVVEDKAIKPRQDVVESVQVASYFMSTINLLGIALRNLVRTPRRTMFTAVVTTFIAVIFFFIFGFYLNLQQDAFSGYNNIFSNASEKRIIVNKFDGDKFTDEELAKLGGFEYVNYLIEHDVIMDAYVNTYEESTYWKDGETQVKDYYSRGVHMSPSAMLTNMDLKEGRLPENENEIVVEQNWWDEYILGQTLDIGFGEPSWNEEDGGSLPDNVRSVTIVGIAKQSANNYNARFYLHEDFISDPEVMVAAYLGSSNNSKIVKMNVSRDNHPITNDQGNNIDFGFEDGFEGDIYIDYDYYYDNSRILIDDTLALNEIKLSFDYMQKLAQIEGVEYDPEVNPDFYLGMTVDVAGITAYYNDTKEMTIVGEALDRGYQSYNAVSMSTETAVQFISEDIYQISLLVENVFQANQVITQVEDQGFNAIYPASAGNPFEEIQKIFMNIFFTFVVVLIMIVVWFISYMVLRNIQRAKQKDYLIFRSIGASKSDLNKVTILELVSVTTLSYILTLGLYIVNEYSAKSPIPKYLEMFSIGSYIIIYFVVTLLAVLLSLSFNKRIFSKSVITSLKQE